MATIQNDLVIRGLSGKVGRQLAVHRKSDGQYMICAAQLGEYVPVHWEAKFGGHQRLYEALLYSRSAPQGLGKDDGVTVADTIHPPEIHRIDISAYTGKAGELIGITAGDDINVASVGVLIVTDEGILVEKGSAILSDRNPYVWTYATTTAAPSRFIKIVVDVADVMLKSASIPPVSVPKRQE